jgi:hypothetical protein
MGAHVLPRGLAPPLRSRAGPEGTASRVQSTSVYSRATHFPWRVHSLGSGRYRPGSLSKVELCSLQHHPSTVERIAGHAHCEDSIGYKCQQQETNRLLMNTTLLPAKQLRSYSICTTPIAQ